MKHSSYELQVTENLCFEEDGTGSNQAPTAELTANPLSGTAPLTVNFDASGSTDEDGTIANYALEANGNPIATGVTPTYTFNEAGTYTVVLTVTDNDGATDQATVTITVDEPILANQAPTAELTANPLSGTAPLTVAFDASGSTDEDGTIDSYVLTANGDEIATGENPSYTFNEAGTYTVVLTVTDNDGATDQATVTITVDEPIAVTCSATGNISFEKWNGISGGLISSIPLETAPDETALLSEFSIPADVGNSYGVRVRGYICAPETGEYTFWISSDDQGELYLSTDDDPANKELIAEVLVWTPKGVWDKYEQQQSDPVFLQAGQKYYIEALMKEAGGGDHLAVAWREPSESFNLPNGPIDGQYLSPFEEGPADLNLPPDANLQTDVTVGDAPLTVLFDAGDSDDPDGTIVAYDYDFQDGKFSSDAVTSNTFEEPGTYVVVLTVTDNDGATDQATQTIIVTDPDVDPVTCSATGNISYEKWNGISGLSVSDIPLETNPDETALLDEFNIPANIGGNYGVRVRGYICPPETGEYTFWMASDDQGQLWLSTDDDPVNKELIASVPGWTPFQDWDKYPEQQSVAIMLQAGQKYYIEGLMKEAGGGDHLTVAWRLPSENFNLPDGPIQGSYLSPFEENVFNLNQVAGAQLEADGSGISEPTLDLFPNPTSDQLNVTLASGIQGRVTMEIADPQGRLIRVQQWDKESEILTESLNVGDLPKGTYLIRILQEDQVILKRFVKR
jgi:PKD repeat protein